MTSSVNYVGSVEGVDASDLDGGFFEGWVVPPSSQEHLDLLRRATHVALAMVDGEVIGFATALSDGLMAAYIPLLEVLASYRGQGIGSQLVRMLMADTSTVYMLDVVCDESVLPFYEQLGFITSVRGAALRNFYWRTG